MMPYCVAFACAENHSQPWALLAMRRAGAFPCRCIWRENARELEIENWGALVMRGAIMTGRLSTISAAADSGAGQLSSAALTCLRQKKTLRSWRAVTMAEYTSAGQSCLPGSTSSTRQLSRLQ